MTKDCQKHKGGVAALDTLMQNLDENQGGKGRHKCPYCAYEEGFKKGIKPEKNEESDSWQPLEIENYEELAGRLEDFSATIKAENGLRASYPDETEFVTETADATAKSLRDKKGVITRKRLSAVINGAYRILQICGKTTRIGMEVYVFIEFIMPFLSSL